MELVKHDDQPEKGPDPTPAEAPTEATEVEKAMPQGNPIVGIPVGSYIQIGQLPFQVRRIKGHGRYLELEAKGFKMQHGDMVGSMTRRPGQAVKAKALPVVARKTPKVELVIPHDTSFSDSQQMLGKTKTKYVYQKPGGLTKGAGLRRARRLVASALKKPESMEAAGQAVKKLNRRVDRWGLKRVGSSGPRATESYIVHANEAAKLVNTGRP